jgi:sugar lactone lactonase YvrE
MKDCELTLVVDAKARIGESPVWSQTERVLYWIDVKAPALHRTDIANRQTTSWHLPSDVGGYALQSDGGGAILALRTGIFLIEFSSGNLTKLCDPPFDPSRRRFNESACDPNGRLWLGTMFDPEPGVPSDPSKGALYSFTIEGGLIKQMDSALLHNGFAWNGNGSEFFVAHSYEGKIYRYEFDLDRGQIGTRHVFAEIPRELGIPDGGAFDADGFYWSAIHGGGRLHRYTPTGELDRIVELPFAHPTMIAFGGADLRDAYLTSATHGKPCAAHEGGVFRLQLGVAGLLRRARLRRADARTST